MGVRRFQAVAPATDALRLSHAAVPLQHPLAKTAPAAVEELWHQGDLRCEQQHAAARGQAVGSCLQVNLGLARTGHPPEQQAFAGGGGGDCRHRLGLGGGESLASFTLGQHRSRGATLR